MDTVKLNKAEIIDETCNYVPVEGDDINNTEKNNIPLANDCLSKRAQRKLLKRQQWLETRPERRAKEKAKKRKKIEKIRQEKGFDQTFSQHRKRLKQKKMSESLCKITVVIDMAFENLMNQKDLGKCLKQLLHCYSINRRLSQPLQFHISSFDGERLKKEMERHQGYENWDCIFHADSYFDVFTSLSNKNASMNTENTVASNGKCDVKVEMNNVKNDEFKSSKVKDKAFCNITSDNTVNCQSNLEEKNDISNIEKHSNITESEEKVNSLPQNKLDLPIDPKQIVYLTSESENILEKFDPSSVYVIGGLVDHNNHKGICHRLALEKGVSHARFPIQEAGIEMKTRQVLTIDHVFGIIGAVASEGKSWKEALMETLPNRKGAKEAPELNENVNDLNEDS